MTALVDEIGSRAVYSLLKSHAVLAPVRPRPTRQAHHDRAVELRLEDYESALGADVVRRALDRARLSS